MRTLATDDFNRADANPIGAPWTTMFTRALQIVSNQVENNTTFAASISIYTGITWPNDQAAQITANAVGTTGNDGLGVVLRGNTPGATGNCYSVFFQQGAGSRGIYINKFLNGAFSRQIAYTGNTFTMSPSDILFAQVFGGDSGAARMIIKVNGAIVLEGVDSLSPILSGSVGLTAQTGSDLTVVRLDNFSGFDFADPFFKESWQVPA